MDIDISGMEEGGGDAASHTGGDSVRTLNSAYNEILSAFKRVFSTRLATLEEDDDIEEEIDADDPLFLEIANKKTSDITEFRDTFYIEEKERIDRLESDKKEDTQKSMEAFVGTRKKRREKQMEVDQLLILEKTQGEKVFADIKKVNEANHAKKELDTKQGYAQYLCDTATPKLYGHWGLDKVRKHSGLETQEQWDALEGLPIATLQLLHGYRCTNLGLKADPQDPKSRVFTYSAKKHGNDLAGTKEESPSQYVERLKVAMGWYIKSEVKKAIRKRRISQLRQELLELERSKQEDSDEDDDVDDDNDEGPPAQRPRLT